MIVDTNQLPGVYEVKDPSFSGVQAGATATCQLPVGKRYKQIILEHSGITRAQLEQIRIKANGQEIQTYTGVERNQMNIFEGRDMTRGTLSIIPFDRYDLITREANELTGLNTNVADKNGLIIQNLTIEVDIATGVAAPTLEVHTSKEANRPPLQSDGQLGSHRVLRTMRFPRQLAAGVNTFSDIPGAKTFGNERYAALNKLYFIPENGEITKVEMRRDNEIFREFPSNVTAQVQADGRRVPSSGMFVIDPTANGNGDMIPLMMFQDIRYEVTATAAGPVSIIAEIWGLF